MSQYLSTQSLYLIIVFVPAVLSIPHPKPPGTTTSQLTSSGLSIYNTAIPSICSAGSVEICGVANKTSLPPMTSANAIIDATLTTANASETTTATVGPSGIPTHLGRLQNTTLVNTTNTKEPQSHKRVDVPASLFYKSGGMEIICKPKTVALQMTRNMAQNPRPLDIGAWGISQTEWQRVLTQIRKPMHIGEQMTEPLQKKMLGSIWQAQSKCKKGCMCNTQGRIIPFTEAADGDSNVQYYNRPRGGESYSCRHPTQAAKCVFLYGCTCTAVLDENVVPGPEYAGQDIYAFARAIDNIPPHFRVTEVNRNWRWRVDPPRAQTPGQRITFSVDYTAGSRPGQDPPRQDSGVLSPAQVNQLNQQQAPPMFGADGEEIYNPELPPDPYAEMGDLGPPTRPVPPAVPALSVAGFFDSPPPSHPDFEWYD